VDKGWGRADLLVTGATHIIALCSPFSSALMDSGIANGKSREIGFKRWSTWSPSSSHTSCITSQQKPKSAFWSCWPKLWMVACDEMPQRAPCKPQRGHRWIQQPTEKLCSAAAFAANTFQRERNAAFILMTTQLSLVPFPPG